LNRLIGKVRFSGILGSLVITLLVALVISGSMATPVQAQALRTWVSGVGDDVNPCSRTAPCKTFAGAISKTAADGEINCLDPGGFGVVTITKSMTIDCTGTFGSILAAGTNGVNINDSATGAPRTIQVHLRGLSISGAGTGLIGINFVSGAFVTIEDVTISGFNSGSARAIFAPGHNVPGSFQQLVIMNSSIKDNGAGVSGGGGIVLGQVAPTPPSSGVVRVTLDNVNVTRNNIGLRVSPNVSATVKSSSIDSNTSFNLFIASGGGPAIVNADDTVFSESIAGVGVHVEGPGAAARLSRSMVMSNQIGLEATSGGQISTAGNNLVNGNFAANGVFNGNVPLS